MNPPPDAKPPVLNPALSPEKTLRRLFLTLFLRGRSSRGLRKEATPKSVGSKLALTLVVYAAFGLIALAFHGQPVFVLSVYLHSMTLVFLGMFVASSAGEVLFNKEEADILMHRPVTARALLWAKIGVLVQVSLWLAGAFNLAGLLVGTFSAEGGWLFPMAHALSTVLAALFCTGSVVLVYQLCLRWFGRERLDGLMTTMQVLVSVVVVIGGQVVPRLLFRPGGTPKFSSDSWWVALLPPAWFAGLDDAIAGRGTGSSWLLAAAGLIATATVMWLAFGKLARDYETGLQALGETVSRRSPRGTRRRWLDVLVSVPPLSWWLRDSVSRGSFVLTTAYMMRDRDVKLRLYPGLAPMLMLPFVLLFQNRGQSAGAPAGAFDGFGLAFAGGYLGMIPLLALSIVKFSQQWQAADIFRIAPIAGPAALCHGARRAVLLFLAVPAWIIFGLVAWFLPGERSHLPLMLPGIIALPIYAMAPCLGGNAVPLSMPSEEAKSAGRGIAMIGVMLVSVVISGLATWAWSGGWFWWFVLAETILVAGLYTGKRATLASARWDSVD